MATGYHDFTAGETLTAANLEDFCMKQSVMIFASAAARNSALAAVLQEGMWAYLLDTNTMTVYSGAAWSTFGPTHGVLTAWTPTVTQSVSVTVTGNYSRYQRIGRLIVGWFSVSCTSAGTVSNPILISTPVTAAQGSQPVGGSDLFDSSASSSMAGTLETDSTSTFSMRIGAGGDNRAGIVAPANIALASGDVLRGSFSYEAAADA